MKKIFLMAILFFCINSVGQAKINDLQIAIGGVQIGNTKEYVKNIYGNPDRSKSEYFQNGIGGYDGPVTMETWYYGDTFEIEFAYGKVILIRTIGRNGLKTPDGIECGIKNSRLYEIYGIADEVHYVKGSEIYSPDESDRNIYFNKKLNLEYIYMVNFNNAICFYVKQGIITSIMVWNYGHMG